MANRPMGIEGNGGNIWPRSPGRPVEANVITEATAQSALGDPGENRPGLVPWLWSLRRGHVILVLALGAWVVLAALAWMTWYLLTPH